MTKKSTLGFFPNLEMHLCNQFVREKHEKKNYVDKHVGNFKCKKNHYIWSTFEGDMATYFIFIPDKKNTIEISHIKGIMTIFS